MAQTELKSATDVVQFLTKQHERIRSLFTETLQANTNERERPFTKLRQLLAVHETAEEEIVHPRAKREIDNGGDVIAKRLSEENEAKKILAQLEQMNTASQEFASQLSDLRDSVVAHADSEESQEFAELEKELSSEDLERMGRTVKLAEAVAPTMPHAGVESRAGNLLVGPFAAMVDRARDAILGNS